MSQGKHAPRLHGILRLRVDRESPLGVSTASLADADVLCPADLPSHALELHAFRSREAACAFADGVAVVGSQSVAASPACGPGGMSVLLARLSEDRPAADSLDDAVSLTVHGKPDKVVEAAAFDERLSLRKARQSEADASWSGVAGAIARLPKRRPRSGSEFEWRMASLSVREDGGAAVTGTLDPDPVLPDPKRQPMHREIRVDLRHAADGFVTATLNLQSVDLQASPDRDRWRAAEMVAACEASGWGSETATPCAATWNGSLKDGGGAFRSALLALPGLVAALTPLAAEARLIEQARTLASKPIVLRIMQAMLDAPDNLIRMHSDTRGSTLVIEGVTRRLPLGTADLLLERGFVATGPRLEAADYGTLALSERGAAAARDHAGLMAEMRQVENREEGSAPTFR